MRFACLALLLSATAFAQLEVLEVHLPQTPVWGSNVASITIRNSGAAARDALLNWQTNSVTVKRGWGRDSTAAIAAGETRTVDVPFIVGPFPGSHTVLLRVRD